MRPDAPPAPLKVHATDTRMAICVKATRIRYGRERTPAWVYTYDDRAMVTVMEAAP